MSAGHSCERSRGCGCLGAGPPLDVRLQPAQGYAVCSPRTRAKGGQDGTAAGQRVVVQLQGKGSQTRQADRTSEQREQLLRRTAVASGAALAQLRRDSRAPIGCTACTQAWMRSTQAWQASPRMAGLPPLARTHVGAAVREGKGGGAALRGSCIYREQEGEPICDRQHRQQPHDSLPCATAFLQIGTHVA